MKKILASLLTVVFLGVSASAADISEEQINTLNEFNIFQNATREDFADGTFMTRAQFTKAAYEIMKFEDGEVKAEAEPFPDVPLTHPESGYISVMKEEGIICGDENGKFNPDENITHYEAAKIIVKILGYEPLALQRGGYPDGYFMLFSALKLHKGWDSGGIIDQTISKNNLGITLANALDTPFMERTFFIEGEDPQYKIMDGKNGTALFTPRIRFGK